MTNSADVTTESPERVKVTSSTVSELSDADIESTSSITQPNWAEKVIDAIRKTVRFQFHDQHYMILTQMGELVDPDLWTEDHMDSLLTPFQGLSIHVVGVYRAIDFPKFPYPVSHLNTNHSDVRLSLLPVSVYCPKSVLLLDGRGTLRVTFQYQDHQYRRIEEVLQLIRQLKFK